MIKRILIIGFCILSIISCTVVKPYEKVNLNDPDMALNEKKSNGFITTFHSYREAATGGNGGKTGGGCGCN